MTTCIVMNPVVACGLPPPSTRRTATYTKDLYPCAKFHHENTHQVNRLVFRGVGESGFFRRPIIGLLIFTISSQMTDNDVILRKDVPLESRKRNFKFQPISHKRIFWPIFVRKFSLKKALTWKTSQVNTPHSKRYMPLDVGCWIGKSTLSRIHICE